MNNNSDDILPEEREAPQQELIALLQHAYPKAAPVTPSEQEQLIARVRDRLLQTDQQIPQDEAIPVQQPGTAGALLQPGPAATRLLRRAHIVRLLNGLAAVLVVGAIIGASLLLFSHRPAASTAPASSPTPRPPAGAVTVYSAAGGLEMSMSLTPGPYFRSEMLAVNISLTNQTQQTFFPGLPFAEDPCGYDTGVTISGGSAPYYVLPIPLDHSCPLSVQDVPLRSGQTLTVHKYVPLTSSGQVTLTAEVEFFSGPVEVQRPLPSSTSSPLDNHWPSIQLKVSPTVPADRKLSYRVEGSHIVVEGPQAAISHLVYSYAVGCQDFHDQGSSGTGNFTWDPLSGNEVSEPGCPGKNIQWKFAFAAPGYCILSGSYPSP